MNYIYNTILVGMVLLIGLGSCSQKREQPTPQSVDAPATTPDTIPAQAPNMDTVRVLNDGLDDIFNNEYDTRLFAKLITQSVPYAIKRIDNEHVPEKKDVIYTFTTEQAEYGFLKVTNSNRVFLIYAQGAWLALGMSDKSGMQAILNKVLTSTLLQLHNTQQTLTPDAVLCVSNADDFTTVTYSYKDNDLDSFLVEKWVD